MTVNGFYVYYLLLMHTTMFTGLGRPTATAVLLVRFVLLRIYHTIKVGPTPSGEPFVIRDILNVIVLIHVCFYWIIIKLIIKIIIIPTPFLV